MHISFHKDWRGGEQQATYLYHELQHKNCLQWVLCSEGNAMETYCEANGLPYYSFKKGLLANLKNRHLLMDICEQHNINIIHVHDSAAHTLAAMACLKRLHIPIVVHRRVDFPVKDNRFSKKKYNVDCIKRYFCVSGKIKEILEPAITGNAKVQVIYSGIDPDRFTGKRNTGILHKEFRLPEKARIIGNTSALADHKDLYTFVDTAEILLRTYDDIYFFIIGEGMEREALEQYIREKNLEKRIILTGFRKDIPDVMPEFDVFLFTSKTEGLGTSVLDAFACGIPVVTTNAGGIPEIVKNNENGLMAHVSDSATLASQTSLLLNEKALCDKLRENAAETIKHFTKKVMAEKIYTAYREIYFLHR